MTSALSATPSTARPLLAQRSASFSFQQIFTHDNPGKIDDFYELSSKQLGDGAFGSVFTGRCKETNVDRAVKCMEVKRVKDPGKFQKEIDVARQLDHPNVVRLYETFRDAKKIYLVMEICTGGELFDRIVDEGVDGFDERKAASYTRQILSAISYLHANRFVHRDVKPENFLFQSKEPNAALKIIDFGLARQFEPGVVMSSKVGTAYYVAPEVLNAEYTEKCDVWSAGVITYILLSGSPPFYADTDALIFRKVRAAAYDFQHPAWDSISQQAKDFIKLTFTLDHTLRPDASSLLGDPWLQQDAKRPPLRSEFVHHLRSFRAHSKLKKVALAVVAQQLPHGKVEELQQIFKALDTNGDGKLSVDEIRAGLSRSGVAFPENIEELVKNVDMNRSGSLDYTEFIAASLDQKMYLQEDVCWAAFRAFDLDGDGKITKEELRRVLSNDDVQHAVPIEKMQGIIEEVDANGDGVIDFEEFSAMMRGTPDAGRLSAEPRRRLVKKQRVS